MKITHLQFFKYKFREYYCLWMHNNRSKLIGKKDPRLFIYVETKKNPRNTYLNRSRLPVYLSLFQRIHTFPLTALVEKRRNSRRWFH